MPRPSFWSRTISTSTARLHFMKPFRPAKPGGWSSASNGTTLQSMAAGLIWQSLNSASYRPSASTAGFPTSKPSSRKSPLGSTTAMPTSPRPTGNLQPPTHVSNSSTFRLALGVGHLAALAGAVVGLGVSLGVLLGDPGRTLTQPLPVIFPFARLSLSVDGLSAYFLLVISLVAVAASIYGPAYLRAHSPDAGPARQAAQVVALNVFLGCMAFVCCAGDALRFLLCWEGMTLASYVLVVSDDRDGENARAGLLYMVMTHGGTALLLVAFLALTERAGAFDFAALRAAAGDLDSATRTTLFFLARGGFATKAGVVPLHVWLPRAHPAAPSHVSALMSGVMLKVAIYGILRFTFDLLAPAAAPLPPSWGWTVLVVGTASAVLGVLYALQQHDLKRLLAYHSVENVGIILIGVGLAMILWRRESAGGALATVALTAALLHTVNHAAFKGMLFLAAGSVLCRTHVRNMEELGGLARRMPWTAGLFLLGAIAISGLPPPHRVV